MYNTKEKLKQIENYILSKSKRDSEFPETYYLRGDESIPVLQRNLNRRLNVRKFIVELNKLFPHALYNISANTRLGYHELMRAIEDVPEEYRVPGQLITFFDKKWKIFQFQGQRKDWFKKDKWVSVVTTKEDHVDYYPDNEDIEGITTCDGISYLRFKDKEIEKYRSVGKVYLRKNLVPDEHALREDDSCECEYINLLTQEMLDKENTIYIVEYDYTLNGEVINIPVGSTLYMFGGSINDGTIVKSTNSSITTYNSCMITNNGISQLNTKNLVGKNITIR